MIEVIDDVLSDSYFEFIENCCLSRLEWEYTENITDDSSQKSQFGFSVPIYSPEGLVSSQFGLIMSGFLYSTLDHVKGSGIIRSRCDMTTYNPNKVMHVPHVDFEDPFIPNITTILYITDNEDCETLIYDKKVQESENRLDIDFSKVKILKKVDPRRNRLVIFRGDYYHTGHSPTKENRRILINSNFSMG